ncbi:hypothetical protein [Neolewinella persica]|uniref:hypothetical protein n=1 Tax=Neolewinella persica TaxID=70998 RepID=UPI00036064F0|nr:hypothetical protein [Neolewinella persica]
MKTIYFFATLAVFVLFACEKEPQVEEWSNSIAFEMEADSDKRFVQIDEIGETRLLNEEEAFNSDVAIDFVWELNETGKKVVLLSPNHPNVKERYPNLADKLSATAEFKSNFLTETEVLDLRINGSKKKLQSIYNGAEASPIEGLMEVDDNTGVSMLMDKYRNQVLIWKYTYDSQGRMLFAAVVGVEWRP